MYDALTPSDFLDAKRIFIPHSLDESIDRIFAQSMSGDLYSITSMIGYDADINEEFFVLTRLPCSENDLPIEGVWRDVDRKRTRLRAEYKSRKGGAYKDFAELYDVRFSSGDDEIIIRRAADDFGIEKLLVTLRDGTRDKRE